MANLLSIHPPPFSFSYLLDYFKVNASTVSFHSYKSIETGNRLEVTRRPGTAKLHKETFGSEGVLYHDYGGFKSVSVKKSSN